MITRYLNIEFNRDNRNHVVITEFANGIDDSAISGQVQLSMDALIAFMADWVREEFHSAIDDLTNNEVLLSGLPQRAMNRKL